MTVVFRLYIMGAGALLPNTPIPLLDCRPTDQTRPYLSPTQLLPSSLLPHQSISGNAYAKGRPFQTEGTLTALFDAHLFAQRRMYMLPGAIVAPGAEVAPHRRPGRKLMYSTTRHTSLPNPSPGPFIGIVLSHLPSGAFAHGL